MVPLGELEQREHLLGQSGLATVHSVSFLNQFPIHYQNLCQKMMAEKLGLVEFRGPSNGDNGDLKLIDELQSVLQLVETDMTIFFRQLANLELQNPSEHCVDAAYYSAEPLPEEARVRTSNWFRSYVSRLSEDGLSDTERRERMHRVNPKFVLRNYLAQLAIDKAEAGDASMISSSSSSAQSTRK